jgi:hypothetical protein
MIPDQLYELDVDFAWAARIEVPKGYQLAVDILGKDRQKAPDGGRKERKHTFKDTDPFGGELKYYSECILNDERPQLNGEEVYADVRVPEGILTALQTGQSVTLPPFE